MMGRQARASTAIMRRWEPNDPGGSCLLHTIGRYRVLPHNRTDRENAGALLHHLAWSTRPVPLTTVRCRREDGRRRRPPAGPAL